jgi:hypothetical protein
MANTKISALPAASTPLAGTEVLPVVQGGITEQVSVANLTAGRAVSVASLTSTGAISGTTGTFSGRISTTVGNNEFALRSTGSTTGYNVVSIVNTGGDAIWGQENSTGNNLIVGDSAYDTVFRGPSGLAFSANAGSNLHMRLGSTGNLTVNLGNVVIGTSGKGIDFSVTSSGTGTMTSELLADYEEGTWTPTLIGTTTNPTVTYTLQRGIYTKVGRVVTVSAYVAWSAISGGSGNIAFGNLPFTVESSVGPSFAGSIALFDGFTLSAGRTSVGLLGTGGTTYSLPSCFGSAVSSQYITVGSVAAGTVQYTLTYSV